MTEGQLERHTGPHQHYRVTIQKDEAHYFDELVEEGEVAIATPRSAPLPVWEELDDNKPDLDNFAHNSTCHLDPLNSTS